MAKGVFQSWIIFWIWSSVPSEWFEVEATVTHTVYTKTQISNWTPFITANNVPSILACSAICKRNPTCTVFDYNNHVCELGNPSDISYQPGGKPGLFDHESFAQLLDVHVLNSADNSNLNGVEVKVTNMETGYVTTDVTNANGFVQFAVTMFRDLTVEISRSGYYENSRQINTGSSTPYSLTISTTQLLPANTLRGTMNWNGAIEDLDLHTNQVAPTQDCVVGYSNTLCVVPNGATNATITYETDASNYGLDSGESLTFFGDFPTDFTAVVYVHNFAEESALYNASLSFSLLGGPQPVQLEAKAQDGTVNPAHFYWIIGCFKPAAGLSSFDVINDYAAAPTDIPCP